MRKKGRLDDNKDAVVVAVDEPVEGASYQLGKGGP
jgi:hypothetical protein